MLPLNYLPPWQYPRSSFIDNRSAELLEARVDQEKDILTGTCERLISLDQEISSGGLRYLGNQKLMNLAELVLSARSQAQC